MNKITFIFSLIFSYILGLTLNKGLSSTNVIREPIDNGIEILKHDIPFIYTVRLNEMFLLIIATIFFFLSIYYYYSKSETSKYQLFNLLMKTLWIENIIFIFIMGSWGIKIIEDLKEDSFYLVHEWVLVGMLLALIILLSMLHEYSNLKNKIEEKVISDLYPSREKLLPILDFYLRTSENFSIVGEWGIGKSKLIENFFKGTYSFKENGEEIFYKNRYECIYVDVSSYADNKKLVEVLEKELNRIFKEIKIFRLDKNFSNDLFNISNDCIELLKKVCFQDKNFNDSREILNKKAEEYQKITNKKIVLCLDNLERINSKERITSLLPIVDEIFLNSIIKIYLYDDKYMEKLFEGEDFKKYIEKYSQTEIEVKEVDIYEMFEEVNKKLNLFEENILSIQVEIDMLKIDLNLETTDFIRIYDINLEEEIEGKVNKKIEENKKKLKKTIKKLSNPRYIYQILTFIGNNYFEYDILDRLKYKILIDTFGNLDLEDEVINDIFFSNLTPYEERKRKEIFEALNNLEKKVNKYKVDEDKNEMLSSAKMGNGKDIIKYIDFCIQSNSKEEIQEFFDRHLNYQIETFDELQSFFEYYCNYGFDVEKIKIKYKEIFLQSKKSYGMEMDEKITKVLFLRKRFTNIRATSRLILSNLQEERLYKEIPIKFEEELKKLGFYSINAFVFKIKEKYEEIKNDIEFLEELEIDKDKIIKEFRFFSKIKLVKERGKKTEVSKLKAELLLELSNKKIQFNSIFEILDDHIVIKIDFNAIKIYEEINITNIDKYRNYLKKLEVEKESYLLKTLRREVAILNKNLKD